MENVAEASLPSTTHSPAPRRQHPPVAPLDTSTRFQRSRSGAASPAFSGPQEAGFDDHTAAAARLSQLRAQHEWQEKFSEPLPGAARATPRRGGAVVTDATGAAPNAAMVQQLTTALAERRRQRFQDSLRYLAMQRRMKPPPPMSMEELEQHPLTRGQLKGKRLPPRRRLDGTEVAGVELAEGRSASIAAQGARRLARGGAANGVPMHDEDDSDSDMGSDLDEREKLPYIIDAVSQQQVRARVAEEIAETATSIAHHANLKLQDAVVATRTEVARNQANGRGTDFTMVGHGHGGRSILTTHSLFSRDPPAPDKGLTMKQGTRVRSGRAIAVTSPQRRDDAGGVDWAPQLSLPPLQTARATGTRDSRPVQAPMSLARTPRRSPDDAVSERSLSSGSCGSADAFPAHCVPSQGSRTYGADHPQHLSMQDTAFATWVNDADEDSDESSAEEGAVGAAAAAAAVSSSDTFITQSNGAEAGGIAAEASSDAVAALCEGNVGHNRGLIITAAQPDECHSGQLSRRASSLRGGGELVRRLSLLSREARATRHRSALLVEEGKEHPLPEGDDLASDVGAAGGGARGIASELPRGNSIASFGSIHRLTQHALRELSSGKEDSIFARDPRDFQRIRNEDKHAQHYRKRTFKPKILVGGRGDLRMKEGRTASDVEYFLGSLKVRDHDFNISSLLEIARARNAQLTFKDFKAQQFELLLDAPSLRAAPLHKLTTLARRRVLAAATQKDHDERLDVFFDHVDQLETHARATFHRSEWAQIATCLAAVRKVVRRHNGHQGAADFSKVAKKFFRPEQFFLNNVVQFFSLLAPMFGLVADQFHLWLREKREPFASYDYERHFRRHDASIPLRELTADMRFRLTVFAIRGVQLPFHMKPEFRLRFDVERYHLTTAPCFDARPNFKEAFVLHIYNTSSPVRVTVLCGETEIGSGTFNVSRFSGAGGSTDSGDAKGGGGGGGAASSPSKVRMWVPCPGSEPGTFTHVKVNIGIEILARSGATASAPAAVTAMAALGTSPPPGAGGATLLTPAGGASKQPVPPAMPQHTQMEPRCMPHVEATTASPSSARCVTKPPRVPGRDVRLPAGPQTARAPRSGRV